MKYIFFGTPKEATIVLDTLKSSGFLPSLIVTAPDRPSGRGLHIEESPVAIWGNENSISVIKPESLREKTDTEILQKGTSRKVDVGILKNILDVIADVSIVFAYGKIIPEEMLNTPTKGTLNIHPSLLPLHRGPSPVEGAILAGDAETGVSLMLLDAEMDHGPILDQEKIPVMPNETAQELLEKLVKIGAEKLAQLLPNYVEGKLTPQEQDHSKATYTKKITRADGEISPTDEAEELYRKYLAYNGWPGIYFFEEPSQANEHRVRISIKKARLDNGAFIIERIVPEGKKEIDYADYLRTKNS